MYLYSSLILMATGIHRGYVSHDGEEDVDWVRPRVPRRGPHGRLRDSKFSFPWYSDQANLEREPSRHPAAAGTADTVGR